jgi:ABC-2 type transport system permease protein
MMYIELDDFRQSYVVAKNEILKFVRGKKFTLYVVLVTIVYALITFLPYVVGGNLGETPGMVIANYVSFIDLLIILAATLFASIAIVSEFEERTALILFTRPIKKTSIFVGKVLGCIVLETVMIVLFYLGMAVASLLVAGSVSADLFVSLGISFLFIVAASSVAIFISSVMKKGSTCAILTFVFLLLILPIISSVIEGSTSVDPWFMLNEMSSSIGTCIPEYVDMINEMLQHMGETTGLDFGVITAADIPKTVATMAGWSIVSLVLAWIAFIRREF